MKNIIKKYSFWFLTLLFLEFSFSFMMFDSYLRISIINILIYILIISAFLSIISATFKDKKNKIVNYTILSILWFLYSLQLVFYKTLKSFFSLTVLGIGDQLKSFIGDTLLAILRNFYALIIFALPLILYIYFRNRVSQNRNNIFSNLVYMAIFFIGSGFYILNINLQKNSEMSIYHLYNNVNDVALNIEKMGVLSTYNLDIYRTIFGFESEYKAIKEEVIDSSSPFKYDDNMLDLSFDKKTNNNGIKNINNYMKNDIGTKKNEYSELFKGYNLIYITAESFSEIAISEELTPTLYKLVNSGFTFNNFYTPNNLSTIGGEFQSMTGLFADNSILTTWRSGKNHFPYGLGNIFKGLGYNTYAFHNNWYRFQDRDKYIKSQGFSNYLGCGNGLEKLMNCNQWPESDVGLMKGTVDKYLNSDKPFMAYYMTVSGHYRYTFSGNNMASKNQKYVNKLPYNESIKAYIATQIELDKALEYLISRLTEMGKLDNTVIVLLADHYPYSLSLNNINKLSTYKRDSVIEVNHNALIIWNSRLKKNDVNKVCMSLDVLPTVLNLFGATYDSRLIIGNDIFSDRPGLAFFTNHSWISESGTYYASSNKFIAKNDVSNNYVSDMNKIVNNRINTSKLIIKNNYYRYLFK